MQWSGNRVRFMSGRGRDRCVRAAYVSPDLTSVLRHDAVIAVGAAPNTFGSVIWLALA